MNDLRVTMRRLKLEARGARALEYLLRRNNTVREAATASWAPAARLDRWEA